MRPFVLYTAVLPRYRRATMAVISGTLGDRWLAIAGDRHLDPTVTTDAEDGEYVFVKNHRLFGGRILFQQGQLRVAARAEVLIVDLNPRSINAWLLLLLRRTRPHRRTLVWGHLHPRSGPGSATRWLRQLMRRAADGCIVYSYREAAELRSADATEPVWVAPNALYAEDEIWAANDLDRYVVLYVGRLLSEKQPGLLLDAFAEIARRDNKVALWFVGDGDQLGALQTQADALGFSDRVVFPGAIHDPARLRAMYARARCAVSPGYAGLSVTQSMCFGVPLVVPDHAPHAPEIELAGLGMLTFFTAGSASALAAAISEARPPDPESQRVVVAFMRAHYSAEAMAAGLMNAIFDHEQEGVEVSVTKGSR